MSLLGFLSRIPGNVANAAVNTEHAVFGGGQPAPASPGRPAQPPLAARVINQINPFDSGRTFSNPTPQANDSFLHQLTHNAVTNTLGNFAVKPLASTATLPINMGRAALANATNNAPALAHARALENQSIPGFFASNLSNAATTLANTPQAVAADIRGGNPFKGGGTAPTASQQKSLNKGLTALNKTTAGQMISPAENAINATIPTAAAASEAAGYNTKATAAQKYIANPALGAAGTVALKTGIEAGVKGAAPTVKAATTAVKDAIPAPANASAEASSGLSKSNIVNENEAGTLRDFADMKTGGYAPAGSDATQLHMQARNAAQTAGIDITSGSPQAVTDRIYNYLSQRTKFLGAKETVSQGGYIKNPIQDGEAKSATGKTPPEPKNFTPSTPTKPYDQQVTENAQKSGVPLDQYKATLAKQSVTAFSPEDIASLNAKIDSLAAEQQYKSTPKVTPLQADQAKQLNMPTAQERRGNAADNTAANPTKVNIPEVTPGDYAKARSNTQLVSNPIEFSTGQAAKATHGLNPSEKQVFWKAVEDPSLQTTPALQKAVARWNDLSNRVHATSQALGGNTKYVQNYARHNWDLSKPEDATRFQELVAQRGGAAVDPYNFSGLNTQPRVFNSIKEGEAAGFKLKNQGNPAKDIQDYGKSSAYALKQQALTKGFTEADMNQELKNRSYDFRNGQTLPLSEKGAHEIRSFEPGGNARAPLRGYRAVNKGVKQTLLSASEFHPINISALKAGPAEALAGHPILAAKGVYGTFRAQLGNGYSDKLQQSALKDGTVEAAARIGTPIKSGTDYSAEGKLNLGKSGLGEKTIFEKAMPAMHIRMVQGAVKDLQRRGISLDSPEARQLGLVINKTMGFVNREVSNFDPRTQRVLSDLALAPQFTRAKWSLVKDALTKGGLAGKYARRAVVGNTAAVTAVSIGLGLLLHQQSDNAKDTIIRNIIHPSVATPLKDSKGNTVELGLPSTYLSEILGLGSNLSRNNAGHLGITANPQNIPGNLENYGRARLASIPSAVVKLMTNTNFAGKPLYDPNAPAGIKAEQAATTLATGSLPIGLQGIAQNSAIKSHLPGPIQQVISANSPGANPLLKSIGSSFGLTPRTDNTVGKGLQTTQYYSALATAKQGLNRQAQDAIDLYSGSKKNPVTGQYDIMPSVNDQRAKATTLLQNPQAIDNLIAMNQKLKSQGQSVDPLWNLSKDQIVKYLQYQAMPPNGADQQAWRINNAWYSPLQTLRNSFFNSLPAGDPNKPKAPIEYPQASPMTTQLQKTYFALPDSASKAAFINANPGLQDQFNAQDNYYNALRTAQGYSAQKLYPQASPQLSSFINQYLSADKSTRTGIRNSNPQAYQAMTSYFNSTDLYNIDKQASISQMQGQPDTTPKELKSISGLSHDIHQNIDGSYTLGPSNKPTSASGSSRVKGLSAAVKSSYRVPKAPALRSLFKATSFKAPKVAKVPRLKVKAVRTAVIKAPHVSKKGLLV